MAKTSVILLGALTPPYSHGAWGSDRGFASVTSPCFLTPLPLPGGGAGVGVHKISLNSLIQFPYKIFSISPSLYPRSINFRVRLRACRCSRRSGRKFGLANLL